MARCCRQINGDYSLSSDCAVDSSLYKTYTRRWGVLASVVSLNMVSYMLVVSFGPIASTAAIFYGVDGDMIDLFALIAMAINIPVMFVSIFCAERFGIQVNFSSAY